MSVLRVMGFPQKALSDIFFCRALITSAVYTHIPVLAVVFQALLPRMCCASHPTVLLRVALGSRVCILLVFCGVFLEEQVIRDAAFCLQKYGFNQYLLLSSSSGNLMEPPFQNQKKFGTSFTKLEKKTIRGKKYDSDSDDD